MEDGTPLPSSSYTYIYDTRSKLPAGVPSKISAGSRIYVIEELVLADENSFDSEAFNPTRFVVPELTKLTVVSNGQAVIEPDRNKQVVEKVK